MSASNARLRSDAHGALQHWGLLVSGLIIMLAFTAMARLHWQFGTLRGPQVPQTIVYYLLAFAGYVAAIIWVERRGVSMRWVWFAALCFRLVFLLTTPTLSDDVYRYLWDGHVAKNGVSPYAYAIDDPALDHLQIAARTQANNTWMASPYLPVAQSLFYVVTALFPLKPIYFQLVMTLFDLASAWCIAQLLACVGLPRQRLLLYLWHPLVVVEVAHGAHVDAWMILLAMLSVVLTLRRSDASLLNAWPLPPLFLALATLTKILPLLLLPVLFWYWDWRQRLTFALVSIGLLIPSATRAGWGLTGELTGRGLFGAIRIYSAQWNFNSGLFRTLLETLGAPAYGSPAAAAKAIVAVALLVVALLVGWRARRASQSPGDLRTPLRLMAVPFMAYLLLSPTVHPWYALFLLAFVPFLPPGPAERRRLWLAVLPWLYLSGALIFSYVTYIDPQNFAEREWVRQLEWLPTYLLLFITVVATWKPATLRRIK